MLHIKLLLSVLLWLGINHLVDAGLTWDFKYVHPNVVQATLHGSKPDCGPTERRYNVGEVTDVTVHCKGRPASKLTDSEIGDKNVDAAEFPVFEFPCNDDAFPVGTSCTVTVDAAGCDPIVSPGYTRTEQ